MAVDAGGAVRFTVTALGSAGDRPVGAVVDAIAKYLLGASDAAPGSAPAPAGRGARYYADSGNEPGRWQGHGAGEMGLEGAVDAGDFASVLAGRDPHTGERLISARGSAGRVASVGVGSVARTDNNGAALYEVADVAAVLGWTKAEVTAALEDGEAIAAEQLIGALCGAAAGGVGADEAGAGVALVPWVAGNGTRYVPARELERAEALVNRRVPVRDVLTGSDPDQELTVPEAARLLGTSGSYVGRLCRSFEANRAEIDDTLQRGGVPKRSYIAAPRVAGGEWRIARGALAEYAARRRGPAVRVGYDVTATTEKSFSVLGLLGGPVARREVLASVQAANDTALGWLERHGAAARAGGEVVGVTGWAAASFRHLTSRRLDPFVHHHNVVANSVVDEAGQRRALDARRLYRRVSAASALATAQVRFELTSRLGVAYRPGRRGGWEVAGVDDAVIDEFSQRTREIRDTVREIEEALGRATSLEELQKVVAGSRPAKRAVSDEAALVGEWWQRARARGLSPERLEGCLHRATPTRLTRRLRRRILAAAAGAVTAERSVFTRADVLATLVDLPEPGGSGPLVAPAAELERLADELLASEQVVPLAGTTGQGDVLYRQDGTRVAVGGEREPEFTTAEMLALQVRTVHRCGRLQAGAAGRVAAELVDATLRRFPELTAEQRGLVAAFTTSGAGVQSAIGRAGTGKTHCMRAAVEAWQRAGYRVVGAAVKAEAARHLGKECGIPTEPLAWYLGRRGDPAHHPFDARTVLIVDEASTVGDRDLDRLVAAAADTGAALRFIGDPAQHGAVAAGGMWRTLTERSPEHTPQLTVGRRVRHEADRAAAEALRAGRAADALAALEAAGHLHVVSGERDLYVALLDRWWSSRRNGQSHPMVDRRNDQRLVLNRLARRLRQQAGELGGEEIRALGDRRFSVGDEVVARMGARPLHPEGRPGDYVRNGAHGTVVAVHPGRCPEDDRISVDFEDLGVIDLPRGFFDEHRDPWGRVDVGLDHAYAVVSYAVEGLTYDESSSHVDPGSTRPEVYVDITRGRDANHVFLTRAQDLLAGERLPAVPQDLERRQLAQRLARSGPETAAVELDPLAGAAAAHARRKTLADLTRERLAARDPSHASLVEHAERIREQQVARRGRAEPDHHLARRLGGRPAEAFLAVRYEDLLGDMAIYRARWRPRPGRGGGWEWALGRPVDHPLAAADRTRLVGRLERFVADTTERRVGGPLAAPARQLVCQLAAAGSLDRVDTDGLRDAAARLGDTSTAREVDDLVETLSDTQHVASTEGVSVA